MSDLEDIRYCNDFINKKCKYTNCRFTHDIEVCQHFWNFNKCKFNEKCKYKHIINTKPKHKNNYKKNTETFQPMDKNLVDMRIIFHDANNKLSFDESLTSKDVIVIKNLFNDYKEGDIYQLLTNEIKTCGINNDKLFKLWHGETHLIADDSLDWKSNCKVFLMVINRIREYFKLNIQSTRFNLYEDNQQFKPYHFDAAAIKPHIAKIQNFTIAISFGATREASFQRDTKDRTSISIPHKDGDCYAFCNDTNILWRHGILQELLIQDTNTNINSSVNTGRISIICWGWLDNIKKIKL